MPSSKSTMVLCHHRSNTVSPWTLGKRLFVPTDTYQYKFYIGMYPIHTNIKFILVCIPWFVLGLHYDCKYTHSGMLLAFPRIQTKLIHPLTCCFASLACHRLLSASFPVLGGPAMPACAPKSKDVTVCELGANQNAWFTWRWVPCEDM
jgi:hypothetical protein